MIIKNAVYVELSEGSGINDRPPASGAPKGTSTTPKIDADTAKPGDCAAKADAMFRGTGRWGCRFDPKGNSADAAAKSAAAEHKTKK